MAEIVRFDGLYARKAFQPVHDDLWRGILAPPGAEVPHSEYWLKGGRGSAKSSFIALELVAGLLADPLASAVVYRRYGSTLRDSVYSQVLWAAERLGAASQFSPRLTPLELRRPATGQRILFRGADDPRKSKSIKPQRGHFKFLWFEELDEFGGMADVRTIRQSVLRGAARAFTFYSYNPPRAAQSWVNAEAIAPAPGRLVHHSTYLDVPPEWLGEAFLAGAEALKAANPRAYANEYLGEVTGTGGQVFDNLELRPIPDAEIEGLDRFRCGLDFGFAVDPDAFVRWAWDRKRRQILAVDEFYGARNPIDALAEAVRARAGREPVCCDGADPRMIAELRRRGLNALAAHKGPGSVEHGMRWLQDLSAIVIDPGRTPAIAREFSAYSYALDRRTGLYLAAFPDDGNHTIDATRYALEREICCRTATTLPGPR